MKWELFAALMFASFGFIISPNWGIFDPGILGFYLLGVILGYNMRHKEDKCQKQ